MNLANALRRTAGACVALVLVGACATIVGIDNASLDPQYDGGAEAGALSCTAYCTAIMANCTGTQAQYTDKQTCMSVCAHLPLGNVGDDSGDTVACRLTHANAAQTTHEPATECPAAGPGGNDVCGSNCDGYCTLMHEICSNAFATIDDCQTACAAVPNVGDYNSGINSGNSLQCRLYHVSAASQQPITHCPHAEGKAICVAPNAPDGG